MRRLLRKTLADCMRFVHPRKYEVNVNNYHFEITTKAKMVSLDIYIDYGFGGSHFYELVKKGAKTSENYNLEIDLFAESVLRLIETYPSEHPLDREKLYEQYEKRMEKEYRNLLSLSHDISDETDLYNLLIKETDSQAYILVSPKTDYMVELLKVSYNLSLNLNYEHVGKLGIIMPEEGYDDISSFLDDHKEDCIFGDALTDYCKALDTEAHPIPWLLYITFNGDRKDKWEYDLKERYTRVLNYLAVKENRSLFQSLTPEMLASARNENKPLVFNITTDDYYEDPYAHYWSPNRFEIRVPETEDFDEALNAIKTKLIEHKLI